MTVSTIPFFDLRRILAPQRDQLLAAAAEVIDGGMFVLGERLADFEHAFAQCCGARHAIGVGNGLDALRLMLRAAIELGRLAPGDEVLVPGHTFIASALAITDCGLTPVFVDVCPHTGLVGVEHLEQGAGPRTRGALVVHLYGQLCDMTAIQAWCDRRGIALFEDAAQAHGARLAGAGPGNFGAGAGFSFFPTKNLGALGDGGAVVTDDAKLAESVTRLRNYGSTVKYIHESRGVNSRLDEIQAAFLQVRLAHFDSELEERRRLAGRYLAGLKNPLVRPLAWRTDHPESHVWHLFVVRSQARDALRAWLERHGVATQIHYPIPPHLQGAYHADRTPVLPAAESLSREVLSLPLYPGLTDAEQDVVTAACNAFPG